MIEKRLKVKHLFMGGEILYNINDLIEYIKTCDNYHLQIGECIILPYYICNDKRMELYQYEFVFSNEYDFETFIKRKTGAVRMEDIPREIIWLREKCFANCNENIKIYEYLVFLINNSELKKEVKSVFQNYNDQNLYLAIY